MFKIYYVDTFVGEFGSFWVDLFITIIGTLLGFWGAFYLTRVSDRKQERKERQVNIDLCKSRLGYFVQLLESCLKNAEKQLDRIERLADETEANPLNLHFLKVIASNDLDRAQRMDTQEVFYSYFLVIPDGEEKLKNYNKIYSSLDHLYLGMKQAIASAETRIKYVHDDHSFIKKTIDDLAASIYHRSIQLEGDKARTAEYSFLVGTHKEYTRLVVDRADISLYETKFIYPLGTNLNKYFTRSDFFEAFHDAVSKAIVRYNHCRGNSIFFVKELREVKSELAESLKFLKEMVDRLKPYTIV